VTDVTGTPAMMSALAAGDLSLYAYPPVAPEVTVPLFGAGTPQLGSFIVGDDVLLVMTNTNQGGIVSNPRFPGGINFYLRVVQIDVAVKDEGLSTMKLTLNLPPSETPIQPPQ
jgi:hypothetical protein